MDLQQFISESLKQICNGIGDAKNEINKGKSSIIAPPTRKGMAMVAEEEKICFDIAVTVSKDNTINASGGVKIASIGVDTKGELSSKQENIHRISFKVPFTPYNIK